MILSIDNLSVIKDLYDIDIISLPLNGRFKFSIRKGDDVMLESKNLFDSEDIAIKNGIVKFHELQRLGFI